METLFLECAIRAALLVAGAAVILILLRVKDASAQHKVWAGIVLAMLVLPAWTAWGPKAALRVLPPLPERPPVSAPARAVSDNAPALQQFEMNLPAGPAPAAPAGRWSWQMLLVAVYLVGAGALLGRLALGAMRARKLIRGAVVRDDRLMSAASIYPGLRVQAGPVAAPVTAGWFRPRVILPEEWSTWPTAKLDAVLAHEGEHARRRDPLWQAMALFNRAMFWFHPAAWWVERRLATLAEEACDDVVLARGTSPSDYSEYLMDMARAVARSGARVNIAGVAMPGSSLPRRIRRIIDGAPVARVSAKRMALVAGVCAIACSALAAGRIDHARVSTPLVSPRQSSSAVPSAPAAPSFASVVIKPHASGTDGNTIWRGTRGSLLATNITLRALIKMAYSIRSAQGRVIAGAPDIEDGLLDLLAPKWVPIPGEPSWMDSQHFDVEANGAGGADAGQFQKMTQSLLADRFGLAVHYKTEVVPVYALELFEPGRPGPQLRKHVSDGSCWDPAVDQPAPAVSGMPTLPYCGGFRITGPNGSLPENRRNVTVGKIAAYLTGRLDRPVLDRTGLEGSYDFDLSIAHRPTNDYAQLFAAVRQQLGLKLVPTSGPVDVFVIDHVEMPVVDTVARAEIQGTSRPAPTINYLDYVGFVPVTESEILERFRKEQLGLVVGSQLDLNKVRRAERLLQSLLAEHGRESAVVRGGVNVIPATNVVRLVFTATEGPAGQQAAQQGVIIAPGQASANQTSRAAFDNASIKENTSSATPNSCTGCMQVQPGGRVVYTNYPLRNLIATAYAPGPRRTIADAEWDSVLSKRFDIEATAPGNPTREETLPMLQSLLAERFKVNVYYETRPIPVYSLILSKPGTMGPRLSQHSDDVKCIPAGPEQRGFAGFPTPWCGGIRMAPVPGGFHELGNNMSVDTFVQMLMTMKVDRLVLDRTGLTGFLDWDLEYSRPTGYISSQSPGGAVATGQPPLTPILTALQEQLGLTLEPVTEPIRVLVIDHVETPAEGIF